MTICRKLGGATPLETCLAETRLAGFEGIEFGNKFPVIPACCGRSLKGFGLSLISGW
jgi:inosose dehydratase